MELAASQDQVGHFSPLSRLDGRTLQRSLERPVLASLDALWSACSPEDQRILHPIGSFLLDEGAGLDELRSRDRNKLPFATSPQLTAGFHDIHPVCATLLEYRASGGFEGLAQLLKIAVAAALDAATESDRKRIARLTRNIRGALEDRNSPLRLVLQGAGSLPEMVRTVERQLLGAGGAPLHKDFAKAWDDWVRDKVIKWIQDDPEAIRASLRPNYLVPDLEGAEVEIGGGCTFEPDDQVATPIVMTEPEQPGREAPLRVATAKAWARGLGRASQGDLSLPSDQMAPAELVAALASAAIKSAERALSQNKPMEAEPPTALALALATGMRELDLSLLVWGNSVDGRQAVIDPEEPRMYRAIVRPANAVRPGSLIEDWLVPTADEIAWPLPASVHRLLRAIAPGQEVRAGAPVLPLRTSSARRRYRLWDVANDVAPHLGLAASQARLAMASELAAQFGPEAAQLVFGDTFSLSAGAAYYSALPADAVTAAAARIQEQWFGERIPMQLSDRVFGSRLVLTGEAAKTWPTRLRRQMKSLAHSKSASAGFDAWMAHRNYLAAALTAVTGARPGDWIGRLDLDQVIPEYGLVLVSDKATDLLRETRVAATGQRWLADLRSYLDRLAVIAHGELGPAAADLARAILRSDAPLFSVMNAGRVESPGAATLRATMPEPLQTVPNHTRHRLNQMLQTKGVSHELRHAQLGWVLTPAHTLADLSHWSARALGRELAVVLDEVMVEDGWYPPSQRIAPWTWRGVPDRPLKDWDAEVTVHTFRHEENLRRIRQALHERWDEVTPDVLQRLADAFIEYFPSLRLDVTQRQLLRAPGLTRAEAVEITAEHHALLCDRVRQGDRAPGDATEAVATRIHLYRLIRAARRKGVVKGPLPTRPLLSITAEPSPFLPGLGLAVRHAEAFRKALLARSEAQRAHDQGPVTAWIVMAFSATRHLDRVLGAVGAAASIQRPAERADLIRVPGVIDGRLFPMVFGGLPALVLAKRGIDAPKAKPPSEEHLGQWIQRALELPFDLPPDEVSCARQMAALVQAAGRLELSGPERLVMLGDAPLAAVSVHRSLSRDDDWPVFNAHVSDAPDPVEGLLYEPDTAEGRPSDSNQKGARSLARDYERLTNALDPERFPRLVGRNSDGKQGWRRQLAAYLKTLHDDVGSTTNLGLLVGFVRHRLRYGGRVKKQLAHATLGGDLTRFGSDLLAVAGDDSVLSWETDEFQASYVATLLCKPVTARRQAFDALMNFHEYLMQVHQVAEIAEADLRVIAGTRFTHVAPGMVTQREIQQVHGALRADLEAEQALPDATPEAVRLLELRELMYLILEGSGLRPSSAYGLTIGDLILLGPGRDFIRVRVTGEYGRAKSNASRGFIPLEGLLWAAARDRVVSWLEQEKARLKDQPWWKLPVFAVSPGARRRFSRAHLTRRIDQLLKWATGEKKARTYWLRKNRVTARHESAASRLLPTAREVYASLRASGHVAIQTPLASYIFDPRIVCSHDILEGLAVPRADILDATGLKGSHLDMAWQRAGGPDAPARLQVVLERLHLAPASAPPERVTPPPPLGRGRAITPRHLADYARALTSEGDRHEAILRSGLTNAQVDCLERIAIDLVQAKSTTPWSVPGLRHSSAVMAIPRPLRGTNKLYGLLDNEPPEPLLRLAESWVRQPFPQTLHGRGVIMQLNGGHEELACRWLLGHTGINLVLDRSAGVEVLRTPDGEAPSRSHAAGMEWVLALVWIYSRFSGAVSLGSVGYSSLPRADWSNSLNSCWNSSRASSPGFQALDLLSRKIVPTK